MRSDSSASLAKSLLRIEGEILHVGLSVIAEPIFLVPLPRVLPHGNHSILWRWRVLARFCLTDQSEATKMATRLQSASARRRGGT